MDGTDISKTLYIENESFFYSPTITTTDNTIEYIINRVENGYSYSEYNIRKPTDKVVKLRDRIAANSIKTQSPTYSFYDAEYNDYKIQVYSKKQQQNREDMWEEYADFLVSKIIIGKASPVFHKMITASMQEKTNQVIKMHEDYPQAVQAFLEYIYVSNELYSDIAVTPLTDENVQAILNLSWKYGVQDITQVCGHHILHSPRLIEFLKPVYEMQIGSLTAAMLHKIVSTRECLKHDKLFQITDPNLLHVIIYNMACMLELVSEHTFAFLDRLNITRLGPTLEVHMQNLRNLTNPYIHPSERNSLSDDVIADSFYTNPAILLETFRKNLGLGPDDVKIKDKLKEFFDTKLDAIVVSELTQAAYNITVTENKSRKNENTSILENFTKKD